MQLWIFPGFFDKSFVVGSWVCVGHVLNEGCSSFTSIDTSSPHGSCGAEDRTAKFMIHNELNCSNSIAIESTAALRKKLGKTKGIKYR